MIQLQWLEGNIRKRRTDLVEILFDSNVLYRTGTKAGALTVAGQWRNFTAFPNILALARMSGAAARSCDSDDMEAISMTSTFITGIECEVKKLDANRDRVGRRSLRRLVPEGGMVW